MKTVTFTSTISPQLLSWMTKYASKTKQTRRSVLEDALTAYRENEIRKQMKADFKLASKDSETVSLAEWGMEDYSDIVNS